MPTLRPVTHLESASRDYPGAWRQYAAFIAQRWQETPDDRSAGLAAFARTFLQQEPSPTLDYSKRAMLELARAPGA